MRDNKGNGKVYEELKQSLNKGSRVSVISGNEFEIRLRNELNQSHIAKECAEWIKEKVQIKSLKRPNPAQPRLVYIENNDDNISINGTVDFTTDGLGITHSNRIE